MKKFEKIYQCFESNNWILSASQLVTYKIYPYQIKELIASEQVYKLKYGWYKFNPPIGETTTQEYQEMRFLIPQGVLCLLSAAFYYQLTTFVPSAHQVAIPRKSKPVRLEYPPIDYFYWDKTPYELGKELVYKNTQDCFYIYNIEKTVCDLIKYRDKIGMEVCKEVLKTYLHNNNKNLDLLSEYAKKLRIFKHLNNYLTILL